MHPLYLILLLTLLCTSVSAQQKTETGTTSGQNELLVELERFRAAKDHKSAASTLKELVNAAHAVRDFQEGFQYSEERLAEARKARDTAQMAGALADIGLMHVGTGEWERAEKYYLQAMGYAVAAKDSMIIYMSYNSLANVYNRRGKGDTTLLYRQRALDILQAFDPDNEREILKTRLSIGRSYLLLKDYRKAKEYVEAAVSGLSRLNDARNTFTGATILAEINANLGDDPGVTAAHAKALEAAAADADIDPQWLYYHIAQYKRSRGQLDSAVVYFERYAFAVTAAARKSQREKLDELETKFRTREQKAEIDRLALEDDLNRARLSRQSWIIIGGLITLGIFAAALYFLMRQRRRIRAQNQLIQKSLEEKEVLVKEIHHRVKNNLQMVSSLLSLQSRYISDAGAVAALKMGNSRVRSMALIHQRLYLENEIGTRVNAKDYLEKLADELVKNLTDHHQRIDLQMEIDDLELDIDTMIPLGLIANELITNALKYAFEGRSEGRLSVVLTKAERWVRLLTEDDGPGFTVNPADNPNTFGYLLINNLVDQLEGNLFVDGREGTRVRIEIPSPGSNT